MATRYCFYSLGFDETDFYDREVAAPPAALLTELVPRVLLRTKSFLVVTQDCADCGLIARMPRRTVRKLSKENTSLPQMILRAG